MSDESPYVGPAVKPPGLLVLLPRPTPGSMSQEILWAEIVRHTVAIHHLQTEVLQRFWASWGLTFLGWH